MPYHIKDLLFPSVLLSAKPTLLSHINGYYGDCNLEVLCQARTRQPLTAPEQIIEQRNFNQTTLEGIKTLQILKISSKVDQKLW